MVEGIVWEAGAGEETKGKGGSDGVYGSGDRQKGSKGV